MAYASVVAVGGCFRGRQGLAAPPFFCSTKHAASQDAVCLVGAGALPVSVFQATCDAHLQAACSLRVCTFNDFRQTYRAELTGQIDGVYEDCLVVGSLDLNQTPKLPDEMSGSRPEGSEGQQRRGYLSNVCVAKTVQRSGVGTKLVNHARTLAIAQGISDLYTHVAVDNAKAKRLYEKSGFILEKMEKTAEARLLGRPPRLLLWMELSTAPKQ